MAAAVFGGTMLSAAGCVLADPMAPNDASLTLHGVTLYGLIDIGLQYNTHAVPVSDYYLSSTGAVIQKNGNKPLFALVSNNMAVSARPTVRHRGRGSRAAVWSAPWRCSEARSAASLTSVSQSATRARPPSAPPSSPALAHRRHAPCGRAVFCNLRSVLAGGDRLDQCLATPSTRRSRLLVAFCRIGLMAL
jgi:hypothetical protein